MNSKEILKDIGARTNGDVYLGVVGPVRTGKSTFIKRFMEIAVVPNIQDEYLKGRTIDELPQSGEGKTIMTTEPKFIPSSAATVQIDEEVNIKIRLVETIGNEIFAKHNICKKNTQGNHFSVKTSLTNGSATNINPTIIGMITNAPIDNERLNIFPTFSILSCSDAIAGNITD